MFKVPELLDFSNSLSFFLFNAPFYQYIRSNSQAILPHWSLLPKQPLVLHTRHLVPLSFTSWLLFTVCPFSTVGEGGCLYRCHGTSTRPLCWRGRCQNLHTFAHCWLAYLDSNSPSTKLEMRAATIWSRNTKRHSKNYNVLKVIHKLLCLTLCSFCSSSQFAPTIFYIFGVWSTQTGVLCSLCRTH